MRPSWDQYFLGMAFYVSCRSHDKETKVGGVISDSNNHIVGVGYNGLCSGVEEEDYLCTRPHKYPFMVHAEQNALANLTRLTPLKKKAYITHYPCAVCLKLLWQHDVKSIVVPENKTHLWKEEDGNVLDFLIRHGLDFKTIEADLMFKVQKVHKEEEDPE